MNCSNTIDPKTNYTIWRICAWGGPIFLFALLICWALIGRFFPPPPEYWNADQVYSFYLEHNIQIRIGMVGTAFFGAFYLLWTAVVSRIIQRIEGPDGVLANIEIMGGVATALVVEIFSVLWLTASFRTEFRSPQDVQLLHDLGWFMFDLTFMVTFFQIIAFGTAMLIDKRKTPLFPRWLGWLSYFSAFVFLPVVFIAFITEGPFAWHGLISFYIALSPFFVWMALCSYYMFKAINVLENETLS